MLAAAAFLCLAPIVTDGDTIRCGEERVRLLGIDAPEMAGHCRKGRICAPGDPIASRDSLRAALVGKVWVEPVAQDRYGRTVAMVSAGGIDLSCWQLRRSAAIYKLKWDNGGRVAAACPDAIAPSPPPPLSLGDAIVPRPESGPLSRSHIGAAVLFAIVVAISLRALFR